MSLQKKMLQRLLRWPPARVFSRHDFLDIGATDAIGMALMRLEKAGSIRRVRRGFYDRPISHPEIGILSPSADGLAQAIARRDGIRLDTPDAAAANLLRLSDQVPARIIYNTDGRQRTVRIGLGMIEFRKRSPRKMAAAGRISGLVMAGLRSLGRQHVTSQRVAHLRTLLKPEDRRRLLKDLRFAPAWMHAHLRFIAGQEKPA